MVGVEAESPSAPRATWWRGFEPVRTLDRMSMGSDLLLLAVDRKSGRVLSRPKLAVALAAADLVELLLAGRIALDGDRLTVLSHRDVPDRPVDAALRALAADAGLTTAANSISDRASSAYVAHLREAKQSQVLAEARLTKNEQFTPLAVLDEASVAGAIQRLVTVARSAPEPGADDAGALADLAYAMLADAAGLARIHVGGLFNRKARAWLAAQADRRSSEHEPERSVRAIVRIARRKIEQTQDRPGDSPVPWGEQDFTKTIPGSGF